MDTKACTCGGIMTHSDDMGDPNSGSSDKTPFWQCEDCGAILNDTTENTGDESDILLRHLDADINTTKRERGQMDASLREFLGSEEDI